MHTSDTFFIQRHLNNSRFDVRICISYLKTGYFIYIYIAIYMLRNSHKIH